MRVIGIDPSLTATGIAAAGDTWIPWCRTIGRDGVTKLPLAERIAVIDELTQLILDEAILGADLWVIEEPAFSRSGGGAIERHALWWLLVRRLTKAEVPLAVVKANLRALYATGRGGAPKQAVVDAVARRLPMFETGGDDNRCDAAVLCAMGCDWLGEPLAVMPVTHRVALQKVTWPETVGAGVSA